MAPNLGRESIFQFQPYGLKKSKNPGSVFSYSTVRHNGQERNSDFNSTKSNIQFH